MARKRQNRKEMMARLKRTPAYKLAYKDLEFLSTDDLRPIRLQLELLKPELILRRQNIVSTIVVFGGTRIVEPAEAERKFESFGSFNSINDVVEWRFRDDVNGGRPYAAILRQWDWRHIAIQDMRRAVQFLGSSPPTK